MKVVFCLPTVKRPYQACLDSLEASIPLIQAAGWEEGLSQEIGNPYISAARAKMLRMALDAKADVVVFIDHDMAWRPEDLVKLIETEGDVVGGTYRFKGEGEPSYMGTIHTTPEGIPIVREDGAIKAKLLPAGFLKITSGAIDRIMTAYPELCYGEKYGLSVDLFNHGAYKGLWWGEDYAFCRRWEAMGEDLWLVPDLQLDHYTYDNDGKPFAFEGNFHMYLRQRPGGDLWQPST